METSHPAPAWTIMALDTGTSTLDGSMLTYTSGVGTLVRIPRVMWVLRGPTTVIIDTSVPTGQRAAELLVAKVAERKQFGRGTEGHQRDELALVDIQRERTFSRDLQRAAVAKLIAHLDLARQRQSRTREARRSRAAFGRGHGRQCTKQWRGACTWQALGDQGFLAAAGAGAAPVLAGFSPLGGPTAVAGCECASAPC